MDKGCRIASTPLELRGIEDDQRQLWGLYGH